MSYRYQLEIENSLHRELARVSEVEEISFAMLLDRALHLYLTIRKAARNGDAVGIIAADQRAALKAEFTEV
ncbi:hypothetical protein [Roseateles sp.]|uniref:hypothetical protein n=1 Tax=Roseateles sp. TaxID=1971397 RepID=UPI0031D76BB6